MLLANIHDFIGNIEPSSYNLLNYYEKVEQLAKLANTSKKIAFYGHPDQKTINIFMKYGFKFLDLDINLKSKKQKIVSDVYCHIIRDIIDNAIGLKSEIEYIICTSGRDKCDQGRNVRDVLSQLDFKLIDASNYNTTPLRKPIISMAKGNLKERVIRIMELVYKPLTEKEKEYYIKMRCNPSFNYHGVPPQDIDMLSIFPDNTHIQGWTRLVEMGIPYRVDLEWQIDNKLPSVYFSQSFCNKQLMSEFLANKNNGLYIDGHGTVTNSIKVKLEAFLSLKSKNKILKNENNCESYFSGVRR